jgi:inner membrane protease ATP23
MASFERWRVAITSLAAPPPPLRCESIEAPKWESGTIMQDPTAMEKTADELKQEAKDCKRCEAWRDELMRDSQSPSCLPLSSLLTQLPGPIVRFMIQHLSLLPPPADAPPAENGLPLPITCRPCPPTLAGGYSPLLGILLCQNRIMSKSHVEDALAHELVHAWDGRRFEVRGGKEWAEDLRAHACTEVSWTLSDRGCN